mmetsp:Transcript_26857/g.51164  ORF Transcript_26857/g.51164 Transcript_26857/m.51164 type:complete len:226 (+) Transcript_26857:686-1363(+)
MHPSFQQHSHLHRDHLAGSGGHGGLGLLLQVCAERVHHHRGLEQPRAGGAARAGGARPRPHRGSGGGAAGGPGLARGGCGTAQVLARIREDLRADHHDGLHVFRGERDFRDDCANRAGGLVGARARRAEGHAGGAHGHPVGSGGGRACHHGWDLVHEESQRSSVPGRQLALSRCFSNVAHLPHHAQRSPHAASVHGGPLPGVAHHGHARHLGSAIFRTRVLLHSL